MRADTLPPHHSGAAPMTLYGWGRLRKVFSND
jgi:hypothetical protein